MTKVHLRQNNIERMALNSANINIKKGYRGIVCLNCTSYMTGLRNVWSTNTVASKQNVYDWKPQTSADGII